MKVDVILDPPGVKWWHDERVEKPDANLRTDTSGPTHPSDAEPVNDLGDVNILWLIAHDCAI